MFIEERESSLFAWENLGNIKEGRPNLGSQMNIIVYRLMQYTLRDVLIKEMGYEKTNEILYQAGYIGGKAIYDNLLTKKSPLDDFLKELEEVFIELKIGIIRFEKVDIKKMEFVIVVEEDLDCSGLSICNETICTYDEGFLAGILESFTNKEFIVKEVDCWCTGERVCRFSAKLNNIEKC